MSKFYPGALAVIRVTEWPRNLNRVVELIESVDESTGSGWCVKCVKGGTFDGWEVYHEDTTKGTGRSVERLLLGIAQWKLSPYTNEPTYILDGVEYVDYQS